MKGKEIRSSLPRAFALAAGMGLAFAAAPAARAQEMVSAAQEVVAEEERPPAPPQEPTEEQRRIGRARALAAVGKLAAAAADLEAVRAATADESARDVARILLMAVYVEMPDYTRAGVLLEDTFNARSERGDSSRRSYYTLAGQTVKSARVHLDRYRSFGIDPSDGDMPAEAGADLDHLRQLLERVVAQAKAIRGEDEKASGARVSDATALLEDAANVRLRLARSDSEREQWRREVADARQRLFTPEALIASINQPPPRRPPAPTATPAPSTEPTEIAEQKAPQPAPAAKTPGDAPQGANAPATRTASAPAAATSTAGANTAAPASGGPVAVGALIGLARQKVAPSYPAIARNARVMGVVTVHVLVNEKGDVESVVRADGPIQLQQAATDAARRWKFRPTVVNSQPVRVSGYLSFNFTL